MIGLGNKGKKVKNTKIDEKTLVILYTRILGPITRELEYSNKCQKSRVPGYSILGDGITKTNIKK